MLPSPFFFFIYYLPPYHHYCRDTKRDKKNFYFADSAKRIFLFFFLVFYRRTKIIRRDIGPFRIIHEIRRASRAQHQPTEITAPDPFWLETINLSVGVPAVRPVRYRPIPPSFDRDLIYSRGRYTVRHPSTHYYINIISYTLRRRT